MKKILSLLVVLGMLFSSFPVISQAAVLSSYDETEAKELLSALNIIDEDMTPKVTRNIFVESLMRFIYDDASVAGKPEDFLKANNMLDEKLAVTSTITVHEAIKYAVIILGYRIKAETEGGYPSGYLKAASDLKLTEGIAVGENSVMRQSQMLRLLYNMLDAEPLEMQFSNASNVSYEVAKNETLLSMYRHIYRIEGIQTANEHTSIYNEEGVRDGYIKIDNTLYETKVSKDFLGEYVIGYVQEDKYDELSVIFLSSHKGKNNILTLDTEDIEEILSYVKSFCLELSEDLKRKNVYIKTITFKYKTNNFENHTRSRSLNYYTNDFNTIYKVAKDIINDEKFISPIRLIGITVSSIKEEKIEQLKLF